MADPKPIAGAKIYIGGVKASQDTDFVAADFDAETWTAVDGWTNCGTVGDASEMINTQLINRGRDYKQKGTRNAGSMQNSFVEIPGDAGQQAMEAAEKTTHNYAFKIEWDDIPDGGTTPTTRYFVGLVTSWQNQGGGANTVWEVQSTVEINSNIVRVEAA